MDTLIPRNTMENTVSGGWGDNDGWTGWESHENGVFGRFLLLGQSPSGQVISHSLAIVA